MLYFESNQAEAQEALDIIKHYGMNDQCFVGRPDASMKYWLVNNGPPVGSFSGEDCIGFNPATIEVKQISGRWKIVDGNSILMDFANVLDEANESYDLIQYYQFTRICFVGRPDPSMTYFRR